MTSSAAFLTVIGLDAAGRCGSEQAEAEVAAAEVLLGGRRHLALTPAVPGQVRVPWPSPLRAGLPALLEEHAGRRVVALASGDPMRSGIGTTLVGLLGEDRVRVLPAVSSVALARARLGWSAESCAVVTLVGRDVHGVLRELAPGRRVIVLASDEHTPGQVAALLVDRGYAASRLVVLGDLGAADESVMETTASAYAGPAPRLNVLALELAGPPVGGWVAGLPDDAFEHDGQLTKRDVRASALARLAPVPGERLWDVGAGAGSVGIEWMRAHPTCRAVAVESRPDRAARVLRNARALGVPALEVVEGRAPQALTGLASPDAVFIGGGATRTGVLDACLDALRPGGRLVVHGVTLETEAMLAAAHAAHGGELTRLAVEQTAPVGTFTGWTPARTVTQWSLVR
ncbi:precorrin-6y C5,15-methyltransferase (decarboxylating) subunit CbiE [Nocardioides insulae]|uniref:precorrin-6y C5,15-methyltransferase (decarboxylating) subunit CbiE n=1 Tax=Nocardioides insulae TaxID=394734 RepID=UPI0003FE2647|nr:precorrin-6y C5,15-methyltransferase (decarboxylating) subunit CbiE [Nocardioides insulae]